MKTKLPSLLLLSLCTAAISAVPSSSRAADDEPAYKRLYLRGDLGGNVTCPTRVKRFFGSVDPGTRVEFDPGARFGVAVGYPVTDWFTPEGQMGVMVNGIRSITGADDSDAVFSNVSFLVNARFQPPKRGRLSPYIGGGLGFSSTVLASDGLELNGVRITGASSAATFAYQAFGGLRCALNPRMGLSVEYRYFATTDPEWDADGVSGTMRFAGVQTHALSAAFDFSF